jgi:hypothetical protein
LLACRTREATTTKHEVSGAGVGGNSRIWSNEKEAAVYIGGGVLVLILIVLLLIWLL